MTPVFYDPPYDSPLEDLFAWNAAKYLDDSVTLRKQFEVDTICGTFRMDFVATRGESRVAFECDGAEFHDERRDEWRDAMILGTGQMDFIYRLRGRDLVRHLEDCLYLSSRWNPELFSSRGLLLLSSLASEKAKAYRTSDSTRLSVVYGLQSRDKERVELISVQRTPHVAPKGIRLFWKSLYAFAQENGGGNLDELITKWMGDWMEHTEEPESEP